MPQYTHRTNPRPNGRNTWTSMLLHVTTLFRKSWTTASRSTAVAICTSNWATIPNGYSARYGTSATHTNEALRSISGTVRHSTKHGLAKSTNSHASKPRSKKYGASFAPSITPIPNAISAHLPIRSRLRIGRRRTMAELRQQQRTGCGKFVPLQICIQDQMARTTMGIRTAA